MNRATIQIVAPLLFCSCSPLYGQQAASPRAFFDSANFSINTSDVARLMPASGTAYGTSLFLRTWML